MSTLKDKTVTMAHGAGGRQTSELIDQIFAAHFANPDLTADDAAVLNPPVGKMAVSTDGFIVSPAFFPGGNIGKLSICGTVNDLAFYFFAHIISSFSVTVHSNHFYFLLYSVHEISGTRTFI